MNMTRQHRIRRHLELRARILSAVRRFFQGQDYLEIDTPVRIPAPAPEAHIDAVGTDGWFLQTSPELCMKRLLAAGYERVFQVCKCFRQGERGCRHLPEMTLLEWYTAGADYRAMMSQVEALFGAVIAAVPLPESRLIYQGHPVDLAPPWDRLPVSDAFDRFASLSMADALGNGRFDDIMGLEIEPRLGFEKPVFLFDYPAPHGALARRRADAPDVAERFELYIAGLELCNAFSELTDADEQRERFAAEQRHRHRSGSPVYPMPTPFLTALDHMPEAAGNALGIDRLVMLFADTTDIADVVTFVPEEL